MFAFPSGPTINSNADNTKLSDNQLIWLTWFPHVEAGDSGQPAQESGERRGANPNSRRSASTRATWRTYARHELCHRTARARLTDTLLQPHRATARTFYSWRHDSEQRSGEDQLVPLLPTCSTLFRQKSYFLFPFPTLFSTNLYSTFERSEIRLIYLRLGPRVSRCEMGTMKWKVSKEGAPFCTLPASTQTKYWGQSSTLLS